MEDLSKQFTSPSWWVSVVIFGILINLVAAYLKRWTDKIIGFVFDRCRRRNDEKEKARTKRVEMLRSNHHEQIMFGLLIIYIRLKSITILLLGIAIMLLTFPSRTLEICGQAIGAVMLVLSFQLANRAIASYQMLREARRASTKSSNATSGIAVDAVPETVHD